MMLFDKVLENRAESLQDTEAATLTVALDSLKLRIQVELVRVVLGTVGVSRLSLLTYIGGPGWNSVGTKMLAMMLAVGTLWVLVEKSLCSDPEIPSLGMMN